MTKDDRPQKQMATARLEAESLLKSAVDELKKLALAPDGEHARWFPHGIDGIKVRVKVFEVEASLELEGALSPDSDPDEE